MFIKSLTTWVSENSLIGYAGSRMVWVPSEIEDQFKGDLDFKSFSDEDKKKFIDDMELRDYGDMMVIFRKYHQRA